MKASWVWERCFQSFFFSVEAIYKGITVGQRMGCVGEELWGHRFNVPSWCLWRICSPLPHFLLHAVQGCSAHLLAAVWYVFRWMPLIVCNNDLMLKSSNVLASGESCFDTSLCLSFVLLRCICLDDTQITRLLSFSFTSTWISPQI